MAFILNLDTATESASLCIAKDGKKLSLLRSEQPKEHAAWLHPAIERAMIDAGYRMDQLEAVAVTAGPGSYTGLRVGMATAKGLCYALKIPLITENTLLVMAYNALNQGKGRAEFFCPMIDARRMEVFTALYSADLLPILAPEARVLDEMAFSETLESNQVLFFGSGSKKWRDICKSERALFADISSDAAALAELAEKKFNKGQFTDIAYNEPVYIKDFHTHVKK